jgi:hypothetical protein
MENNAKIQKMNKAKQVVLKAPVQQDSSRNKKKNH